MRAASFSLILAIGLTPALALAQQAPSAEPKAKTEATAAPPKAETKTDPNKVVCRMEKPLGSMMRQRVCKSEAQLEQERVDAQRYRDAKMNGFGTSSATFGGLGAGL